MKPENTGSTHRGGASKSFGLVLSSGAARGWAHFGVLRALCDIGLKPDVIAGCSVGALVGGAHLLGALDDFEQWARSLQPLSTLDNFTFGINRGGLIDAGPAFEAFRDRDKTFEELPARFGCVACDLANGEEVRITSGSVIDAARASSAIPVLLHAVRHDYRWLVDGALVNPAPVSLARDLGADIVISVDLNAVPKTIERFKPKAGLPAVVETPEPPHTVAEAVGKLITDTQRAIARQFALARVRADSRPRLFEVAGAAADIFQMQLARAQRVANPPDILLQPDLRDATPTSFDRADEFIEMGRAALMEKADDLKALLAAP